MSTAKEPAVITHTLPHQSYREETLSQRGVGWLDLKCPPPQPTLVSPLQYAGGELAVPGGELAVPPPERFLSKHGDKSKRFTLRISVRGRSGES